MSRFLPGNRVDLLRNGDEFFPALKAAIDSACHDIQLETYIFRIDDTTRPLAEALVEAARRGVEVRILVDGFGSRTFPADWVALLTEAGAHFHFYRKFRFTWLPRRNRLRRLHRKLAVIDGRIGFVGGINLHDDRDNAEPGYAARYDYAVRVEGPVLAPLCATTRGLWRHLALLRGEVWPVIELSRPATARVGVMDARLVVRDNVKHRLSIENEYLREIRAARQDILIANAYFLPGLRLRRAILAAARRGVRVELLLQGRPDHPVMQWATRRLYQQFLDAGVQIHEYRAGYMHAKVAVVDTLWSTVGSSNIDPFSLGLAREANLVVRNYAFARELQASIVRRIRRDSLPIGHDMLRKARWWHRGWATLCYGFSRFAINIAGLGEYYGKE